MEISPAERTEPLRDDGGIFIQHSKANLYLKNQIKRFCGAGFSASLPGSVFNLA